MRKISPKTADSLEYASAISPCGWCSPCIPTEEKRLLKCRDPLFLATTADMDLHHQLDKRLSSTLFHKYLHSIHTLQSLAWPYSMFVCFPQGVLFCTMTRSQRMDTRKEDGRRRSKEWIRQHTILGASYCNSSA